MLNYSNEVKPHYNVVITTPGNQMCSEYVTSLLNTVSVLNQHRISWIYQNKSSPIVSNAREATISGSISLQVDNSSPGNGEYTYDKIFMIDSDIVWEPNQFLNFLKMDVDIISGVYMKKQEHMQWSIKMVMGMGQCQEKKLKNYKLKIN